MYWSKSTKLCFSGVEVELLVIRNTQVKYKYLKTELK